MYENNSSSTSDENEKDDFESDSDHESENDDISEERDKIEYIHDQIKDNKSKSSVVCSDENGDDYKDLENSANKVVMAEDKNVK